MAIQIIFKVRFDRKYSGVYYVDVREGKTLTTYEVQINGDDEICVNTPCSEDLAKTIHSVVSYFVKKAA
jgi:hypothetical protein